MSAIGCFRASTTILFVGAALLSVTGCGRQLPPAAGQNPPGPQQSQSKATTKQVVEFTRTALVKLRAIQQEFSIQRGYLRVAVVPASTGGFVYDMKFETQLDPTNDYLCDSDGVQVLVDKRSSMFLEGATIDWQTTPDGKQGFKFDNPNAVKK